jgi:short-subunit dehydrogenase
VTDPRSIFVSGAARGIGRATAELFLARGWRVGTYDVDAAAVEEAAAGRDGLRGQAVRVRSLLPLFVATEMVTRDGVRAAAVPGPGVRLTAEDVAAAAWQVVHERRQFLRSPHRPVGRQTKALAALSAVTPDRADRLVVARMTR